MVWYFLDARILRALLFYAVFLNTYKKIDIFEVFLIIKTRVWKK